ncbi:rtn protein [Pseudomonas fluorescens Q2-87]|uniref:Rtn protein n=1 Tax=Pseudomonas fluorescens (strain Q2-87) TaxID=1038922 RepID=J2EYU4_PSEFQ|nr:rtn protein [Pseudomonas fluorescens Q2-87]
MGQRVHPAGSIARVLALTERELIEPTPLTQQLFSQLETAEQSDYLAVPWGELSTGLSI